MKNFNGGDKRSGGFRGGDRGGKPSFQNKSWNNDRPGNRSDDRDKQMFKATCSDCSKSCEVPFRPSGDKPVFCNDCFNKKRDSSDTRGGRPDFGARPSRHDTQERSGFRPEMRAPQTTAPLGDDTKKQLMEINQKLDRLIGALEKMNQPKNVPSVKTESVVAKTAPVVTVKAVAKKASVKSVATKTKAKVTKKKK